MLLNDFKINILNIINKSKISVDGVYYVLKDILNEVAEIYNQQLIKEQQANAAAQQEKTEVKEEPAAANTNEE